MATELARRIRGTRTNLGAEVKKEWVNAPDIWCEPLVFCDLEVGDRFILMPLPGDNSGHGGLLNGSYLFKKTSSELEILTAIRLIDGVIININEHDFVYKVF